MISIKQAYNMVTQLTDSKNLDSIRSFPDGYGFVFVIDKKQVQQDIIMSGTLIPLTTIK